MGKFVTGPKILWKVIVRELHQLVSRPIYLFSIVIAPLLSYAFFLSLMDNGLPEELPTAIVDLDHSATSRNLTRQFTTVSSLSITTEYTSFTEARKAMQKSEIFGFVIIPPSFEADLYANRRPEISYYTNSAYFIPSALEFRSFKTTTTLAAAAAVQQTLLARGEYERGIMPQIQPITVDMHPLGNPWTNYSIYLNNTFLPGILEVIILLTTIFSIGSEIKHSTSREWLRTADDKISLAITGKLLPQTILFYYGALCQSLLYGYFQFPPAKRHLAYAGRHAAICHGVAGIEYFFHLHCPFPTYRIEYRRTFRRRIILADGIFIPGRSHVPGIPPAYRYSASTPLFHYIRRSGSQRCSFLLQPYALHGAVYIYSFGSTFPASAQTSTAQANGTSPDFTTILQWKTDFSNR